MTSARSANNSRLGYESASTNTSQSPVAAEAPLLRAREIWFIGSNTTVASAARAFSAVRSVELLSQTMISFSQPSEQKASVAALILRSERAMNFSSLNAGTMIEIFTRAFGNARPRKSQRPTGVGISAVRIFIPTPTPRSIPSPHAQARLLHHVRVDLSGRDVLVPEQFLDGANVVA